jgi:hypothetical protein
MKSQSKIYILINCDSKQMISYKAYLRLKSPHIHVTDTVWESIFPIMCISLSYFFLFREKFIDQTEAFKLLEWMLDLKFDYYARTELIV